jgi:Fic family protein
MNSGEKLYIWQVDSWPNWRYDLSILAELLTRVSRSQGVLLGRLADVRMALRDQASLAALTEDVVKTSEIEGEVLNIESVRSSIARRLGVDIGAVAPVDRHIEGVVEMVLDATTRSGDELTSDRLFGWHFHECIDWDAFAPGSLTFHPVFKCLNFDDGVADQSSDLDEAGAFSVLSPHG